MVGNLDNGYVIGLNQNGTLACNRLMQQDVSREDMMEIDRRLCEHLSKGGFFDGPRVDPQVQGAYYHVTQNCNLSCVGCYSDNDKRNVYPDPSYNEACAALRFLSELGVKHLIISGGEPFLRNDLASIVQYAYTELDFDTIKIITNGTILDKEALRSLSGMTTQIAVSVDGYSENCIPYIRKDQRIGAIKHIIREIKAAGIDAHIIPTLHKKNYLDIDNYLHLAEDLGVSINFSLLSAPPTADTRSLLPEAKEIQELGRLCLASGLKKPIEFSDAPTALALCARRTCGFSKNILSVECDGEIYPCHMLHDDSFSLGNVYHSDASSVLNSPFRRKMTESCVDEYSDCSDCSIKYLCGGGCRARAYFASGSIANKDSYCEMIKEFYRGLEEEIVSAKNRPLQTEG